MSLSMNTRLAFAPAALAALLSGACVDIVGSELGRYIEPEEKRFSTTGKPDVDVSTFDGSIEIRPWDRSEVVVIVEKRGASKAQTDRIEVRSNQDGNRVTVEAKMPESMRGWGFHNDRGTARLIVSVPADSNVTAHSGDGSIDIARVNGKVELTSGDGAIHASEIAGQLRVHTGDGSIRVDDVNGVLDLDTGDGSVFASGKLTTVRARTGDGSISIQAGPGSAAADDWNVTTGDGSVTVELPDGFGGELDAYTGGGRIHADDIAVSNLRDQDRRRTLRATLGSGGHTVRLRTGDGSITLRRF